MKKQMLRVTILLLAACLVACLTTAAVAGEKKYPAKPVQIIVPFGAGGGTDTMVRAYQKYIDLGGQPLVVINVAGGAGSIGLMQTYHSKNDGYTILATGWQSMLSYYVSKYVKEPVCDEMVPIATTIADPDVVAVSKDSKFKTLDDVMKFAKAHPGDLKWASVGAVGSNYAASALVWDALGITVNYVPFDSATKSRAALLGGHVDVLFCQVSEICAVAESGDAVPLLVTTNKRNEYFPDCLAMGDIGSSVDFYLYRGFWAPPGTPEPVIKVLESAFLKVNENPEFRKFITDDLKYGIISLGSKETRDVLEKERPELTKWLLAALENKKKQSQKK